MFQYASRSSLARTSTPPLARLLASPLAKILEGGAVRSGHRADDDPAVQFRGTEEESVEVLLGGSPVVDVRDGSVGEGFDILGATELQRVKEHCDHLQHLHVVAGDKPSVGESVMAAQGLVFDVGGQHREQIVFWIPDHEGMVVEPVAVVVHVVPQEEKGAVLASMNEPIPFRLLSGLVAHDLHTGCYGLCTRRSSRRLAIGRSAACGSQYPSYPAARARMTSARKRASSIWPGSGTLKSMLGTWSVCMNSW